MSPHGTISRYTNNRCRCPECRQTKRIYEAHRLMGRVRTFVPARPSRNHARYLLTNGWSTRTLAARVGVNAATVKALASGRTNRIDARTADRILGVCTLNVPARPSGHLPLWAAKT